MEFATTQLQSARYLKELPAFHTVPQGGGRVLSLADRLSRLGFKQSPQGDGAENSAGADRALPEACAEAHDRLVGQDIDLTLKLLIDRAGGIVDAATIGRFWQLDWQVTRIKWTTPAKQQNYPWLLTPQYAGLVAVGADKAYSNALTALGTELGERSRVITDSRFRNRIAQLVRNGFNADRFLFRLACLYILSGIAGKLRGHMNYSVVTDASNMAHFSNFAAWKSEVVDAAAGVNYIWLDFEDGDPEAREMVAAAQAVAGGPTQLADPLKSSLLRSLPPLGRYKLLTRNVTAHTGEEVNLTHSSFYMLAKYVSTAWNVQHRYLEMLDLASCLLYRPLGQDAFQDAVRGLLPGKQSCSMVLPAMNTSALVLGPMAAHIDDLHYPGAADMDIDWPEPVGLAFAGTAKWALWEASLCSILGDAGIGLLHTRTDGIPLAVMHRLADAGASGTRGPAGLAKQACARASSYSNFTFPVQLQTIGLPGMGNPVAVKQLLEADTAVQWEECLPFVNSLPVTSGFYGLQRAPKPTIAVPARAWFAPTMIDAGHDPRAILYWASQLPTARVALELYYPKDNRIVMKPLVIRRNYRGVIADSQFGAGQLFDDAENRLLLRVENLEDLHQLEHAHSTWNARRWHIEWSSIYKHYRSEAAGHSSYEGDYHVAQPANEPRQPNRKSNADQTRAALDRLGKLAPLRDVLGDFTGTPIGAIEEAFKAASPEDRDSYLREAAGSLHDRQFMQMVLAIVEPKERGAIMRTVAALVEAAAGLNSSSAQGIRLATAAAAMHETATQLEEFPATNYEEAVEIGERNAGGAARIEELSKNLSWDQLISEAARRNLGVKEHLAALLAQDHTAVEVATPHEAAAEMTTVLDKQALQEIANLAEEEVSRQDFVSAGPTHPLEGTTQHQAEPVATSPPPSGIATTTASSARAPTVPFTE